jgi:hypothetical protein
MNKSQRPKKSISATPASREKQASGRRWVIGLVLAAIAVVALFRFLSSKQVLAEL